MSEAYAHTKEFIIPMHFTVCRKKKNPEQAVENVVLQRYKRVHAQK